MKQTIAAYDAGKIKLPKAKTNDKGSTAGARFYCARCKKEKAECICPTSGKYYSKVQIARFCGMMKKQKAQQAKAKERGEKPQTWKEYVKEQRLSRDNFPDYDYATKYMRISQYPGAYKPDKSGIVPFPVRRGT